MELLERYLGLAYDRIYSAMSESERYEVDRWKAQLNVRVAAHIHGRR